jgi:type VI secretion system secreted protein VgrG
MSMVVPGQAYSLTLKPQPGPISVLRFNGRADISALYEYRIEFTSPAADIPMDQVVGRPATFTIEPVDPAQGYLEQMFGLRWKDFSKMPLKYATHGIIQRFENLGSSADETRYRATLVPKIADLARARKSRLFQKQSVVESAPDGVGLVSGSHMQFSASQNLIATAGGSADIGVLRRFTVAAGDAISMFAQRMGMKLFAKGKVEVQSQSDEMALSALKDITITSSDGRLILSAAKEVWIGAAGSYIKINANRIENGTPGDILEKCSAWSKQGATSTQQQRQKFFDSQTELSFSQQFHVDDALLNLSEKTGPVKYRILDETGVLIGGGVLAESGRTLRAFTETSQPDQGGP